jgi:hypothetical protein
VGGDLGEGVGVEAGEGGGGSRVPGSGRGGGKNRFARLFVCDAVTLTRFLGFAAQTRRHGRKYLFDLVHSGLYFCLNVSFSGEPVAKSPYGRSRIIVPAGSILDGRRLYVLDHRNQRSSLHHRDLLGRRR